MLVKVIEKYKDLEIGDIVPAGVILEVNEARANVLKVKGKAVDYILPAPKPAKKEIKPKVEEIPEPVKDEVIEDQVKVEELEKEPVAEPVAEEEKPESKE